MAAPVVTFYEDDDATELNNSNPLDFGTVDAATTSDEIEFHIHNNKGGSSAVSDMENVRITEVTKNGLSSGDGAANGEEMVEDKWALVRSITNEEVTSTAVGGATTHTLANIRGDILDAPGAPTGTPGSDAGSIAEGTYYYVVVAVDETGETLKGTESSAVVVASPNNQVDLAWTAVTGATGYKVYRTTSSGTYTTPALVGTVETNSLTDTLATPTTGAPLGTATVTYGHQHDAAMKLAVPSDATAGEIESKTRILYQYT